MRRGRKSLQERVCAVGIGSDAGTIRSAEELLSILSKELGGSPSTIFAEGRVSQNKQRLEELYTDLMRRKPTPFELLLIESAFFLGVSNLASEFVAAKEYFEVASN